MDPGNIVEDTEQTRFGLQTDGQMDGLTDGRMDRRMDKVKPAYPPSTLLERGIIVPIKVTIWDAKS